MLTGKSFRLKSHTLGIESRGGRRIAVTLPSKAIVEITGGPTPEDTRLVEVRWEGRELVMFLEDLQRRAEEIAP